MKQFSNIFSTTCHFETIFVIGRTNSSIEEIIEAVLSQSGLNTVGVIVASACFEGMPDGRYSDLRTTGLNCTLLGEFIGESDNEGLSYIDCSDRPSDRLTIVGCHEEEVDGEVRSIRSFWWLSSSFVVASIDKENGEMKTWVDICSSGMSSAVSTNLVNTLSSSIIGRCRMGLVLCRDWESASICYFRWVLIRGDSFDFLSISIDVTGSAL